MIIDVAYLLVMVLAVFKGVSKGLIIGIFSFVAFIIGIAAALKLSAIVAHYLGNASGSDARWIPVISFIIVFIGVVLLINLGARLLKNLIRVALLGWLDRLGGIILFAIIYTIIFSVLLFFAEKTQFISAETIAGSQVYYWISPWGPKVIDNLGYILPVFKNLFAELQLFFEKIGNKIVV